MNGWTAAAEPASAQRQEALGALPEWDLSDLYPGPDSEPLAHDFSALTEDAEAFRDRYKGRLAALSGAELGAAVAAYERLQEKIGRIMSYASLVHAGNLSDPELGRFYQTMQERTNAVSTELLFFTLELNRLEDADLEAQLADPASRPLSALAARHPRVPPAPAQRRDRKAAAREICRWPGGLGAPLRRDDR